MNLVFLRYLVDCFQKALLLIIFIAIFDDYWYHGVLKYVDPLA